MTETHALYKNKVSYAPEVYSTECAIAFEDASANKPVIAQDTPPTCQKCLAALRPPLQGLRTICGTCNADSEEHTCQKKITQIREALKFIRDRSDAHNIPWHPKMCTIFQDIWTSATQALEALK